MGGIGELEKKKKICLLKYIDAQQMDGGLRVAVNLANSLCDFYDVHFIAMIKNGDNIAFELDSRVYYKKINFQGKRMRQLLIPMVKSLRNYFRRNKLEVVFSIGASPNLYMILGCMGMHIKTVYCEHVNIVQMKYNDRSQRICQCLGAELCDNVITLTQRDKEEFEKRFPVRRSKIQYIYNWVEDEILLNSNEYAVESKRILTVGRITPVKGLEELVQVAKKVLEKHSDWEWDIYGSGEEQYVEQIAKLIRQERLETRLHMLGQADDMYERYGKYSFFVLTSKWEGLPMVLLEAKGKKLPLISFDCPTGPAEIIRDGIDGYLIPQGDVEQMADKIEFLMVNEECRKRFSEESAGNLHLFRKSEIIEKWKKLIENEK